MANKVISLVQGIHPPYDVTLSFHTAAPWQKMCVVSPSLSPHSLLGKEEGGERGICVKRTGGQTQKTLDPYIKEEHAKAFFKRTEK